MQTRTLTAPLAAATLLLCFTSCGSTPKAALRITSDPMGRGFS